MANRAATLKLLRNALVILVIKGYAGVATHAVTKVNAKTPSKTTRIAVRTVEDGARSIIVEVTNTAKVLGKRPTPSFAFYVDTFFFGGLQSVALHTHDFGHRVTIERFFFYNST